MILQNTKKVPTYGTAIYYHKNQKDYKEYIGNTRIYKVLLNIKIRHKYFIKIILYYLGCILKTDRLDFI